MPFVRRLMMQAFPSPEGWFARLSESVVSAVFGALVVLVTFRTRLALMDREIAGLKKDLSDHRTETERRHSESQELWTNYMEQMNRRQNMVLEIVAGIARKVGTDARFSDALLRFLNEDSTG